MNFLEELEWRGMVHTVSSDELKNVLNTGSRVGYIGFDPTAPSLTIGNFVQIMLLKLFQLSGHHPIVLLGGATGRIGDPSGRDTERDYKSYEELDTNLAHQSEQFKKFLDFDGVSNKAIMVNNYDFYNNMNVLTFLRDVGRTVRVKEMLKKTSVEKRMSSEEGLSFTEFSYQIIQGYDFQYLYENHDCILQMGGSDQWGNIVAGTEFVKKNLDGKAFAITTPLLTKADGSKFGKSAQGNIWLDANLTSPYKFYQFWINADDRDLPKFMRYFTLKSREEVEALEAQYADDPRMLKAILAEELTRRVHSDEDYDSVQKVTKLLYGKKANKAELLEMRASDLKTVAEEIPSFSIAKDKLANGISISDLLTEESGILSSKGEVRRAIKGNAISVNKDKISNHEATINHEMLLHGTYLMVENGKKNKYILVAE